MTPGYKRIETLTFLASGGSLLVMSASVTQVLLIVKRFREQKKAYNTGMNTIPPKPTEADDLHALALMLADAAVEQGVNEREFTFYSRQLDIPEGDSVIVTVRREKQVERVAVDWLHIGAPVWGE